MMMVILILPIFSVNEADTYPILWYYFEDGDSKTVSLEDGIFEAVEQVLQVR